MNLIVDETPDNNTTTGNNVGKTTVLRLIDFCLGKSADGIYKDPENNRGVYTLVKDFLINSQLLVTLTLVDDLDNPTREIIIKRNFLQRKDSVCEINDKIIPKIDFEDSLMNVTFPDTNIGKPSFRQIISHNIRYDDSRINKTLKTLDAYTKLEEYETLYLYMFGCNYEEGNRRQELITKGQNESNFKARLEKKGTKSAYKSALDVINADIEKYNNKKANLNINPDLDKDLLELNDIKSEINKITTDITGLSIRQGLIIDARNDFISQRFDVDVSQLRIIYHQASALMPNLQKTFEDLVAYHNQMIGNKIRFIESELPMLGKQLLKKQRGLDELRAKEKQISQRIVLSDTFEDLEKIVEQLNVLYQRKGEYESIIAQISEVDNVINGINDELNKISEGLFSENYYANIESQLSKFNKIFSEISERLYNEKYAIQCNAILKRGQKIYQFSVIDVNFSSGKKQGEISCFDIAYTIFADQENIPCLHFLLNDKKELMHGNQLKRIADVVSKNNIQFVASILEDKLPDDLKDEKYYVVKLSQNDKLFRIEQQDN
ncbi:MAG: DUF2326 domain-containing protein [Bacteroidales bacterium]|nr:DUF2326 domain-containing protein [Candidatus Colimorpha merdihippi]